MHPKNSLSLKEVCSLISVNSGELENSEFQNNFVINCVVSLNSQKPNSISFYNGDSTYLPLLKTTKVCACLIKQEHVQLLPKGTIAIICQNPYLAVTQIVEKIYGSGEEFPQHFLDISALQKTDPKFAHISPHARISADAVIGKNVTILAEAYIGCNVEIGEGAIIHSHASLEHCTIGKACVIRSGARVGCAGFGFVPNFKTGAHIPIPQISRVVLEDFVDIGANSTIDRGFLTDTQIGAHTKIDNLVHIAHGVKIGRSCFFAGGTSVAGSCQIGNFCMIGGHSAIANNVILPDFTEVLGMSGIAKGPAEQGKRIIGAPAIDHIAWKRIQAFLHLSIKKKK